MVIHGGRIYTGLDALAWAREAEDRGAGEICLNSIDADGTRDGYDIDLTRLISSSVRIPVIASGGAGVPTHLLSVLTEGLADAALIASMVHYRTYTIGQIKEVLAGGGVAVRLNW
jgi:cyclase